MKLAICDDEKRIQDIISDAVRDLSAGIEIECFSNAKGILEPDFDADILFLDIQMPGIDGMKAARMIREEGKKTVIVFVTAFEEQVFNAFEVEAFQYIVKPFAITHLKEVMKKAIEKAEEIKNIERTLKEKKGEDGSIRLITVKSGGTNRRVILSEIMYAEIYDRRILLHMRDRDNIEYYGRIWELEKISGKDFFRVHRAFLINMAYVKSYDSKIVRVGSDDIPVARGKYQDLIQAYLTYHTRRAGL